MVRQYTIVFYELFQFFFHFNAIKYFCIGLTKKIGEISMKQDLAILTIKLQDTDPVTGKLSIRERDYFGFVLSNSEKDTPLSDPSAITDPQLQRQCKA